MLRCDPTDPFTFMRPMSILSWSKETGELEILFKVVGEQTSRLAQVAIGQPLPAIFPLGKAFSLPEDSRKVVCIAGGTGIPPILYLAEVLSRSGKEPPKVFFGARSRAELITEFLKRWEAEFIFATDDGSYGYRGTVVDIFKKALPGFGDERFYACGPLPMLRALKQVMPVTLQSQCEVSLEEIMACGIGACYGCAVGYQEIGIDKMKLVCRDGTVFDMSKVVLN